MKILLISYSNYDYDGRLRSLIDVFSQIGELSVFMRRGNVSQDGIIRCDRNYGSFIFYACQTARHIKDIDILVMDNRRAVLPGMFIKRMLNPRCAILDCRELYLANEMKSAVSKIGCLFEGAEIKKADIVICANEERARFMERHYHLPQTPLVYENLRRLRYDSEGAKSRALCAISGYIHRDEYRILSTSGCSVSRTNDILVNNIKRVQYPCRLFLVGASSHRDTEAIKAIIQREGLRNVEIIPPMGQNELKALIQSSHIGIVNYHQRDSNNKFCASGKVYEFIYEGLPVVTTTNPPLEYLCRNYGVGVSDDLYADGINQILGHYETYRNAVNAFAHHYTISTNNNKIVREICDELETLGLQVKTAEES